MKKSKLLALGLIALVLAGGLALASCGPKCSNKGDCSASFTAGQNVMGVQTPGTLDSSSSGCDNSDCKVVKELKNQANITNGKAVKYSCDC